MKSILLHMNDDGGMESRLQVALDMARGFEGHVTCLQAVSFDVFAPGDFYGSALAAAMPVVKEAAEQFRARTEADLGNEDVSWEWLFRYGMAEQRLLEQSAINDVIIVGARDIDDEVDRPSQLVGELVMRARTPVLVVPESSKRFDCAAPALIAWNGSTEAGIAMRAALPLLRKASKVYIATVTEENDRERYDLPPTDGAEYLSRHGIESEVVEVARDGARVADALFGAAQVRRCGYVVMGAYGHSRLAEMLLGGVTRRALTAPPLPIFLAH